MSDRRKHESPPSHVPRCLPDSCDLVSKRAETTYSVESHVDIGPRPQEGNGGEILGTALRTHLNKSGTSTRHQLNRSICGITVFEMDFVDQVVAGS